MGGFKLVTRGDSSRQGDVSLELAVLEPPPPPIAANPTGHGPPGECSTATGAWKSSDGIISDKPEAEALFTTALALCLVMAGLALVDGNAVVAVLPAELFSLLLEKCSSSIEIENFGNISRMAMAILATPLYLRRHVIAISLRRFRCAFV